jgi:pyruvate dehydrogenase E2 component (dihydrolipoamide acetyltransferase)
MLHFQLPDVGEGLHEAEIVRWLVRPGDVVAQDQPMVEIQTDKALVEISAPQPGRIVELRVTEGSVTPVGLPHALPHQCRSPFNPAPARRRHPVGKTHLPAGLWRRRPCGAWRMRRAWI